MIRRRLAYLFVILLILAIVLFNCHFLRSKLTFIVNEVVIAPAMNVSLLLSERNERLNIDEVEAATDEHTVKNVIDAFERILNIFLFRLICIICFHIFLISDTEIFQGFLSFIFN